MIVGLLLAATGVLALLAAAFCAGAETAFMSVNRGRVLHLAREGSAAAKVVEVSPCTSTTSGRSFSSIARIPFRTFAVISNRSCFSFILPKLFCSTRPLRRSLRLAPLFRGFSCALAPLTAVAMAVTGLFVPKGETKVKVTANDLLRILQDRKDGVRLTDFESALISRILVMRRRGEFMTVEGLLRALDDE